MIPPVTRRYRTLSNDLNICNDRLEVMDKNGAILKRPSSRTSAGSGDFDRFSFGNNASGSLSARRLSRSTSPQFVLRDVSGDAHEDVMVRRRSESGGKRSITDVFSAIIKGDDAEVTTWLENGEITDINVLYKGCCATHHAGSQPPTHPVPRLFV